MKKFLSVFLTLMLAITCLAFTGCSVPKNPDKAIKNLEENGYETVAITELDEINEMIQSIPGIPEGKIESIVIGNSGTSSITIFYCVDKDAAKNLEESLDEYTDDNPYFENMEVEYKGKRVWVGDESAIKAAK